MKTLQERAEKLLSDQPYDKTRGFETMGNDYYRHINAMTEHGLRNKSEIGEEFAIRDILIRDLLAALLNK